MYHYTKIINDLRHELRRIEQYLHPHHVAQGALSAAFREVRRLEDELKAAAVAKKDLEC